VLLSMCYYLCTVSDPMENPEGEITLLLRQWRDGSREAENELFERVMPNLLQLAHSLMRRERQDHSLQATELVDQIYFRMVAARDRDWQSRKHFFAIAARAMRRHLIDHARARPDAKFVALEDLENALPAGRGKVEVAVAVDRLLDGLSESRPEWCTVVEMKFFLGFTDEETAQATGVKVRTVQRNWSDARQWLFTRIASPESDGVQSPG
jgi:RNA polymerase sigma factor (TIGR02999 family)